MKYPLLALSLALLTSFGGNLKQFQKPENAAMSGLEDILLSIGNNWALIVAGRPSATQYQ